MSTLFGGSNNRDISDIVSLIQSGSITNEAAAGATISEMEIENMSESVSSIMAEHIAGRFNGPFESICEADVSSVKQIFKNSMVDRAEMMDLSEAATTPSVMSLTASIATTMRQPYEAVLHRLYDTRTLEKQVVEIETVVPTILAPGEDEYENLIDALSPNAETPFVDRTEILVTSLTNGVEVPVSGVKDMALLEGMNSLFSVNRDVRLSRVEAYLNDGITLATNVSLAKGSTPYFSAKECALNCVYEIVENDGSVTLADVTARIDFNTSKLVVLRTDPAIKKVYFDATVCHAEHTHPIRTSFTNSFESFIVPTRPHIEVSLPQEMRTDIANTISHFANVDVITAMTGSITDISTRMEDMRLYKGLDSDGLYEATFSFKCPSNFNLGNLEWMKREFIPFLDQCALKLKNDYNMTDCHFRCGVSPHMLRCIDTDYTLDKSMTEESRGSGNINYSIGCKTSTSVFYFISSQMFAEDGEIKMLLIPNNFKMSQVKTYNYFKYSSFMTDQLRRSDNHAQTAIVYSERNMPVVFEDISANVTISNLPTVSNDSSMYIIPAGAEAPTGT